MPGIAVSVRDLVVSYRLAGGERLRVLDIPVLDVAAGGSLAVTGPSGSGKTSLLHVLAGLEVAERGRVAVGATDLAAMGEGARDRWRRDTVGFVFQDFNLFPGLSAVGNVLLPASFGKGRATAEERRRAEALLHRVSLRDPHQAVETLSRGEMQRVAVARALLHRPPLVLADEPTASLDPATAADVAALLAGLCAEEGSTLVVVTHDTGLAGRLESAVRLVAGRIEQAASAAEACRV